VAKLRYTWSISTGAAAILVSGVANADAGVPMLFVTFPAMLMALMPIIIVETFVLGRMIRVRVLSAIKPVAIANVVSTVVGIPIAWFVLVFLELLTGGGSAYGLATPTQRFLAVTWQAPWLDPYGQDLSWMVPTASLVLLVPFFLVSYWIEALIVSSMMKSFPEKQVRKGVFAANLSSYALLAAFNIAWLVCWVIHPPKMA